jgi:hypothetical protein
VDPFNVDTVDPSVALEYSRNAEVQAALLLRKWSKRPTLNTRTGKVEHIDWLGQESVDRGYGPPLKTAHDRMTMAVLLENQMRFQDSKRLAVQGGSVLLQDTADADLALPTKFALPIVRRMYAIILGQDFLVTQPLPGPTGYVFWLDFLREADSTNILSVEYNAFLTAELGIPAKGKIKLSRTVVTALKQLMGMSWSLEAFEDARAQLGLDIEQALIGAFSQEFLRNLLGRHILDIYNSSITGTGTGANLVNPWSGPNTQHQIPNKGASQTDFDYKTTAYSAVLDADADFQRANRYPSDGILAGYGLSSFLQKLNTAVGATGANATNMSTLGISDYGSYMSRWQIQGTDFLPDNVGFLYKRNPDQLEASYIYCPYVPLAVMPATYAGYNTGTGAYTNTDEMTRNLRERSAQICVKQYGFQPIIGPAGGLAQF